MRMGTLAMMVTLSVVGLAIGCSSAPEAPAAPAAPVANLSEKEAIAIARSSDPGNEGKCWRTTEQKRVTPGLIYTDLVHNESASFKPSGIWVITIKSAWNWEHKYSDRTGSIEWPCTYVVDDSTGRVTQN